jgi:hypothetical protein
MNLDQALKTSLQLTCEGCGGRQPGYIIQLIDEHGEDAEVKDAIGKAPCMWCSRVGRLASLSGGAGLCAGWLLLGFDLPFIHSVFTLQTLS